MGRLTKSQTYYRRIKAVFPDDEVGASIARISVLFEDLRLEYNAAKQTDRIDKLDVLRPTYRTFYFVRRSTITLDEFRQGFEYLNQQPGFAPIRKQFDADTEKVWREAGEFFREHKALFKKIRDAYGGHFLMKTARKVLADVHPDTVSTVEIVFNRVANTAEPRLHYTFDLAASAFVVHKDEDSDMQPFIADLFETIWKGWENCVAVVETLVVYYIIPAFRG